MIFLVPGRQTSHTYTYQIPTGMEVALTAPPPLSLAGAKLAGDTGLPRFVASLKSKALVLRMTVHSVKSSYCLRWLRAGVGW